jgi:hypothetical protein
MPATRSSVIQAFDYEAQKRRLWITFTSGKIYVYLEVPAEVYAAFLTADSKGEFFNEEIRDQYSFVPPDGPFPQARIIRDKGT